MAEHVGGVFVRGFKGEAVLRGGVGGAGAEEGCEADGGVREAGGQGVDVGCRRGGAWEWVGGR